ncbi:hypothetical protein Ae201684P_006580 [Aphanomyces euteiches]|uniref:Uncharacterized protein n=1 Tax=Aphanomyces euteiches TaxID=100861 RepID=A0A6G0XBG6_9STRA|nr:hypothetical protein Ae201684_006623 [Aphanomyces euteiches]KAH9091180.1 hypothetical protein Ae201684P_006580 [Aphanomyces euteiches]
MTTRIRSRFLALFEYDRRSRHPSQAFPRYQSRDIDTSMLLANSLRDCLSLGVDSFTKRSRQEQRRMHR